MENDSNNNSIEGYLIDVKPGEGKKPRLDLMVQHASGGARRVLYFTPESEKRKAIEDLHKSPIKLTCLKQSSVTDDFIFTNETVITNDDVHLDFQPFDMDNLSIAQAKTCAIESLISIKGLVKSISSLSTKGSLKYQSLAVSDSTDIIKVLLWNEMVGLCKDQKSYAFKGLKVKKDREYGDIFFGTAFNKKTVITEINNLKKVSNAQITPRKKESIKINGEIMSVSRVTRFSKCHKCPVTVCKTDNGYYCSSCKETMKEKFCKKKLVANLKFID